MEGGREASKLDRLFILSPDPACSSHAPVALARDRVSRAVGASSASVVLCLASSQLTVFTQDTVTLPTIISSPYTGPALLKLL